MPRKRILYLQSNKEAAPVIKTMLDEHGYETIISDDVTEANKHAATSRFSLYLLESPLLDEAELELCRQIRRLDSANPVLFYSKFAFKRDVEAVLAAGATGYCISAPDFLVDRILHLTAASAGQTEPAKTLSSTAAY